MAPRTNARSSTCRARHTNLARLCHSSRCEIPSKTLCSGAVRWMARVSLNRVRARPRELMRDLRHAVPLLKKRLRRRERDREAAKHRGLWRVVTEAQAGMPVLLNCTAMRRPEASGTKSKGEKNDDTFPRLRNILQRSFLWRRLKPTLLEDGVEGGVGGAIPVAGAARLALGYCCALICARLAAGPFDCTDDVVAGCCVERLEFAGAGLQCEAVLVVAARRVWAERGDADAIFGFGCERAPLVGRAVKFGRHPAFDVPAIEGQIFRDLPELDRFPADVAVGVAVSPAAADPGEARAAPDDAEVRFAVAIGAAGARDAGGDRGGGVVRFASDADRRGGVSGFGGHGVVRDGGEKRLKRNQLRRPEASGTKGDARCEF